MGYNYENDMTHTHSGESKRTPPMITRNYTHLIFKTISRIVSKHKPCYTVQRIAAEDRREDRFQTTIVCSISRSDFAAYFHWSTISLSTAYS